MKIIGRIITILVIFCSTCFVGMMVYLNFYGKDLLTKTLTKACNQSVSFENIVFKPPFVFYLINLNIGDDIKANRVDIYPHFNSFFSEEFSINRLVLKEAEINLESNINTEDNLSDVTAIPTPRSLQGLSAKSSLSTKSVFIQHLIVEGSTVNYRENPDGSGLFFVLNNVELEAQNIVLPNLNQDIYFKISSILGSERKMLNGGRVNAEGWLNWAGRNMQGVMNIQDKKLKDALRVVLTSADNDLKVEGEIKIKDFGIEILDENGEDKSLQNLLSDVLSTVGIDVGARFNFTTKLDDFKITNIAFKGSIVSD